MTTVIRYCPMCQENPKRPKNQNLLNETFFIPKICPSCQDSNDRLKAEALAAETVRVRRIDPGVSGRKEEDRKTTLRDFLGRDRKRFKKEVGGKHGNVY